MGIRPTAPPLPPSWLPVPPPSDRAGGLPAASLLRVLIFAAASAGLLDAACPCLLHPRWLLLTIGAWACGVGRHAGMGSSKGAQGSPSQAALLVTANAAEQSRAARRRRAGRHHIPPCQTRQPQAHLDPRIRVDMVCRRLLPLPLPLLLHLLCCLLCGLILVRAVQQIHDLGLLRRPTRPAAHVALVGAPAVDERALWACPPCERSHGGVAGQAGVHLLRGTSGNGQLATGDASAAHVVQRLQTDVQQPSWQEHALSERRGRDSGGAPAVSCVEAPAPPPAAARRSATQGRAHGLHHNVKRARARVWRPGRASQGFKGGPGQSKPFAASPELPPGAHTGAALGLPNDCSWWVVVRSSLKAQPASHKLPLLRCAPLSRAIRPLCARCTPRSPLDHSKVRQHARRHSQGT